MEPKIQALLEAVVDEDFYAWCNYSNDLDSIKDLEIKEKATRARDLAIELMDAHEDFVNTAESKGYVS